ncbi:GumC family protein [Acuticoccus sp.]|uniref:GumC family protein n=1 Tax=Acuticoccus sp. TaxID=1904378 RepID=UPI003B52FFA5
MNFARAYADDPYRIEPRVEPSGDGRGLDLRQALRFVWRSKWVIVVGAVVGACVALLKIAAMTPTYTASATVLFMPEQRNVVDIEDVLTRSAADDDLRNQIEILRSRTLMTRVVERVGLHGVPYFNPELQPGPGAFARALDWRSYVPWETLADVGIIDAPDPAPALAEADRVAAQKALARDILIYALVIQPVPNSRVIRLSMTLTDPQLAARAVNAVAQEYITAQLDASLAATREATVWLSERVEELKVEVAEAEAAVSTYRADLSERTGQTAQVLEQQLDSLNTALAAAQARRAAADIRHQRAREAMRDTDRLAVIREFQDSGTITAARARERELITGRAELARLVPEGHERLRLFDLRIAGQRNEIRGEAERIVNALESETAVATDEVETLRDQVSALEERLQAQGAEEVRLRELEREAEASGLIYQNFLGRLKETTQQQTLAEADAVILSPAEPPRHADSASKKRLAVVTTLFGAALGLGVAILLDRLNNTFREVEQLEELTGLQVLGTVPSLGSRMERHEVLQFVLEKPSSSLAEAIRSLRTSLLFSRVDEPPQVVMFTSTVPGEGKSTTSLLLALTSAQMGRSAIIVDCDLRRPSLNTFLGDRPDATSGLTDVLEGTMTLEEAATVDPVTGLTILAGFPGEGTVINAADVLASDRFGYLLEDLRERYDLVILDAPPTLSVTDARIVARRVDTTLYCVKWDATARDTVLEGLREFALVKPTIAGIVATMVNVRQSAHYGYGGYYRGGDGDPYHAN